MGSEPVDVTGLLLQWNAGERDALNQLVPAVYNELHRLARVILSRERPGHTLSTTALVHEAYLKLVDQRRVNWDNRAHFFGAAANIMRRVLVDHAKAKLAEKRGGSATKFVTSKELAVAVGPIEEVLALDTALDELAKADARKAQVVEMKFFAGMTNSEVARALGTSDATVERDWTMARAWLIQALQYKTSEEQP